MGASIGVAMFPTDADQAEDLTNDADLAMYRAKEKSRRHPTSTMHCWTMGSGREGQSARVRMKEDAQAKLEAAQAEQREWIRSSRYPAGARCRVEGRDEREADRDDPRVASAGGTAA